MIRYRTQNNIIVLKLELPVSVSNGSIIDIETDGNSEIITFGYITENLLISILRTLKTDYNSFLKYIRMKLTLLKKPFYAYNIEFERRFLGHNDQWIDLMGIHKKLSKEKKLKFPKLRELVPTSYLEYYKLSYLDILNSEVPSYWKFYLNTGDESLLEAIHRHNVIDLISELNLYINNESILSWWGA